MEEAFVIMQIGNTQLDKIWKEVYCPAIKECGLDPKRVDKHNEGRLLHSEIAGFINRAKIIIADLTNERPNCYLEVGYSMGIDKFNNLILCAREDHHFESPNYLKGGPKIHFDLSGYGFLWWKEENLVGFKVELISRIKQRLEVLKKNLKTAKSNLTEPWQEEERTLALTELKKLNLSGYFEVSLAPISTVSNRTQRELLVIAKGAEVNNSGWPIGVVLDNEGRPKPESDGIKTIIAEPGRLDYWCLKKNGRFYFLRSFEEDIPFERSKPGEEIHIDTRIRRVTEAIMYCSRLYKGFKVDDEMEIAIEIVYKGLKNRRLAAADTNRLMPDRWKCSVDEVSIIVTDKVSSLMPDIKDIVFNIISELTVMFDYFNLTRKVSDDIVDKFILNKR